MKNVTMLYDILMPPTGADRSVHAIYLRQDGDVAIDNGARAVRIGGGQGRPAHAAFDTYVNAFAPDIWRTYTHLDNVSLKIRLRGSCAVSLFAVNASNRESTAASHRLESGAETKDFILPFPNAADAVLQFWSMTGEDCTLLSASYVTEVPEAYLNPVRLAVIICTFRREHYARALLEALARSVDAGACTAGELRVFLVDNGRTLDGSVCVRPYMKLIPNRNTGGSGGFARGMTAMTDDTKFQATHMLLMDDDIELPDGALQKTFSLLRLLRPEYASACIGGAMFNLRRQHMHYASVETVGGRMFLHRVFGDIDMRCRDNFLPMVVARRCERQYQAWWYCVYPADLPARYGLPYPFFFQVDDIEYFIRTKLTDVIHLNGIFVRHESFHLKRTNAKNFYSFRNLFIFSELYPSMRLPIYVRIARDMLFSVMSFNYRNFTALRTAADSFLEGPEQMRRPGIYDELSAEAQLSNDEVVDITRYAGCRTYTGHPPKLPLWRKAVMALTLNGHFLPAFCLEECAIVGREGQYRELAVIYLKKTLCYETDSPGYGIVRTCSLQALFRETILLVPILLRFIRKRGEVGTRYRGMHREMTGTAWMQKQKHLKHTDNI